MFEARCAPSLLHALAVHAATTSMFAHLLYGLMEQFAEGREAPFAPTPSFWIHEVEQVRSLYQCTFSLPR